MASVAPELLAHREWLGQIGPVGLVVSPTVLVRQGVFVDRQRSVEVQAKLTAQFFTKILDWPADILAVPPDSLTVALPEYEDHFRPAYASGAPVDRRSLGEGGQFKYLVQTQGRPMAGALAALLGVERVTDTGPVEGRLATVLRESRRSQNDVSTALAGQVLEALWELVRSFQRANQDSKGELLDTAMREAPTQVYGGLLTTLMRLVFVLYGQRPRPHARRRRLPASLFARRALREAERRRRPVSRHDGRPVWRLGAAPGALPAHS